MKATRIDIKSWSDAGLLREQLFNLYDLNYDGDRICLQHHDSRLENRIVKQISRLTKIDKDSIRNEVIAEVKVQA